MVVVIVSLVVEVKVVVVLSAKMDKTETAVVPSSPSYLIMRDLRIALSVCNNTLQGLTEIPYITLRLIPHESISFLL